MRPSVTLQQFANMHLTASLAATGRKHGKQTIHLQLDASSGSFAGPLGGFQSPQGPAVNITLRQLCYSPLLPLLLLLPVYHSSSIVSVQQHRDPHPWPISKLRVPTPPRRSAPVLFTTLTLHRRALGSRIIQPNCLASTPLPLLTAHPGGWGREGGDYLGVGQVDRCLNAACREGWSSCQEGRIVFQRDMWKCAVRWGLPALRQLKMEMTNGPLESITSRFLEEEVPSHLGSFILKDKFKRFHLSFNKLCFHCRFLKMKIKVMNQKSHKLVFYS